MKSQPHDFLLGTFRNTVGALGNDLPSHFMEEGDLYICATCDLPVKPCERRGSHVCSFMLRESTELELLRLALKRQNDLGRGCCALCGAILTTRQLRNNPLRELCPSCESKTIRIRRRARPSGDQQ